MLDGDVVVPGSARYSSARLLWDTRFDGLEATRDRVLRERDGCRTDRTLGSARAKIHIVPRSGGHSYAGYSSGNGVVVADVSRLKRCRSRVRAQRSARARICFGVYSGLAKHGVTIPGGSCPTVGIAGLALGGGVGYSSRRFGTTADNLRRCRS